MECTIENESVPCTFLCPRGLNYGQDDHNLPVVNYTLAVPLITLVVALKDYYEDYAKDDQMYGTEDEEEVVLALRRKGWISLHELSIHEPTLVRDFAELVSHDTLENLFSAQIDDGKTRYLINGVDKVLLVEDKIQFSGEALDLLHK